MTNICEVCHQLREENERLSSELLLANNKINVLIKFRDFLIDICHKFDAHLDHNYKQEVNCLEDYYKNMNNDSDNKQLIINEMKSNNSINNNNNNCEENKSTSDESSDENHENVELIRDSLLQRLSIFRNDLSNETNDQKIKTNVLKKIKVSFIDNKNDMKFCNKTKIINESINNNEKKNETKVKSKAHKKTTKKSDPKSSSNRARYRCDYNDCSFKAHIRRLVTDHINAIHTGERPYVCSFSDCGKAYASLCYLNKHKLHVHSNQKFKCEWNGCQVEVKSRKSLKVHMRRHTGENTFDCDFPGCSFRGTNSFSINDHKNKHTGDKPYKCKHEDCDAMFSYRSTRFTHYVRAHSDVRRFSCDWPGCESAFKDNQALRLHKCIHTGEKSMVCEWPGCDYRCSNSSLLKKHKLVHTQEKKHLCSWPECDMKYSSLSSLKIHLMKHRGEKPNECETCGKRFREKNNLKRHYRTHNKNNE